MPVSRHNDEHIPFHSEKGEIIGKFRTYLWNNVKCSGKHEKIPSKSLYQHHPYLEHWPEDTTVWLHITAQHPSISNVLFNAKVYQHHPYVEHWPEDTTVWLHNTAVHPSMSKVLSHLQCCCNVCSERSTCHYCQSLKNSLQSRIYLEPTWQIKCCCQNLKTSHLVWRTGGRHNEQQMWTIGKGSSPFSNSGIIPRGNWLRR